MSDLDQRVRRALGKLDKTWKAFGESYAGLSDDELQEPGVTGDWSVKDILGHVTTWEEETLRKLPVILAGGQPPSYGSVDAFNAQASAQAKARPLAEVRQRLDATHERLLAYVRAAPPEALAGETRFRQELRWDSWGHYPEHTAAIRAWRERRSGG